METLRVRFLCTTTLTGYLDLAGQNEVDLPVYDPSGRFAWPRRIAERFGASIVPADSFVGAGALAAAERAPDGHGDALSAYARSGAAGRARAHHLVAALTADEFTYAAAVFATIRRCMLERLDTAERIAGRARDLGARYVTLVGPPGSIRFDLLAGLRRELGSRVAVGVLTAPTVTGLSELVLKNLFYPRVPAERDAYLNPQYNGSDVITGG